MSDRELRRLERAAAAGDVQAKRALERKHCRYGRHTYAGSYYGKQVSYCLGCGQAREAQREAGDQTLHSGDLDLERLRRSIEETDLFEE